MDDIFIMIYMTSNMPLHLSQGQKADIPIAGPKVQKTNKQNQNKNKTSPVEWF